MKTKKGRQADEEKAALVNDKDDDDDENYDDYDYVPHSLPSPEHVLHETALRLTQSAFPPKRHGGCIICVKVACGLALVALVVAAAIVFGVPAYQHYQQQSSASPNNKNDMDWNQPQPQSNNDNNSQSPDNDDYTSLEPIRFDPHKTDLEAPNPAWFVTRSGASRLDAVIQILSKASITRLETLRDRSSPQYQAARWLADQDVLYLDLPGQNKRFNDDLFWLVQRYSVAVLYFSTGGPTRWRYQSRFLSDRSVCEWNFALDEDEAPVRAELAEYVYGVQCNPDGAVDMIFLPFNNLSGTIPSEIGQLQDLYHLSLNSNNIEGTLPSELANLGALEFLDLDSNAISGRILGSINQLVSLNYLALSNNRLTGAIPTLSGLDDLEEIALDYNQLQTGIDNLNDCTSLAYIYLSNNLLEDHIDDYTFDDLGSLETFEAGENLLTGQIPSWIYELTEVDLHGNLLNGMGLPEVDVGDDPPLEYLSLYGNGLKGKIPDSYGTLENLVHLELSDNSLTGTISSVFTSRWLRNLYLYKNDFDEGPFPNLQACSDLEELSLAETNLTGTLPQYLGEFTNMVLLDLRDNNLSGQIPESFGDLDWMQYLLLNRNNFSGSVPDSFANLKDLTSIYLDNNQFLGSLNHLCDANLEYLEAFSADCLSDTVVCDCCTICCDIGDLSCNEWGATLRLSDPSTRDEYLIHKN